MLKMQYIFVLGTILFFHIQEFTNLTLLTCIVKDVLYEICTPYMSLIR